jgi:hypothetical protein
VTDVAGGGGLVDASVGVFELVEALLGCGPSRPAAASGVNSVTH